MFKRQYVFANERHIIHQAFDTAFKNADTADNLLNGWFTAIYKKYSLKQTLENGQIIHVEIKLSREELKIIIEQFLKDMVTYLPVEY